MVGKSDDFENQHGEDRMKKKAIMSEAELSYEELRCLENHFRQLQKIAVVATLKKPPVDMVALLSKMISAFRSTDQLKA
jgi:hypothetical protein